MAEPASAHDLSAVEDATICLINRARGRAQLRTLARNEALDAAARLHSHEMRVDRFFGHVTPSGQAPMAQVLAAGYGAGVSVTATAQCIAWGSGSYATPRETVLAWLRSPPHRALLPSSEYRGIGAGATLGNGHGATLGNGHGATLGNGHGATLGNGHGGRNGTLYTVNLARRTGPPLDVRARR
ncbi:MAG: CAP domain-containing protein, partial [Solirubrobacteraceae bacterium]